LREGRDPVKAIPRRRKPGDIVPLPEHLRPLPFAPGARAEADIGVEPLCGRSDLVFSHVEAIGPAGTSLVPVSRIDPARMAALTAPRPDFASLAMDRPRVMGIVNVTPDSFSDGGLFASRDEAVAHALRLAGEGADILDIGGESTRPGSDPVDEDEELRRVVPVIETLRGRTRVLISIDTRKARVMREAAAAGADILNDVSALTHDPQALGVAAETGLPVILMHALGDPKTMNDDPRYQNVVTDIYDDLAGRIAVCEAAGIARANICVDPGIGFGKHLHHNVATLGALSLYHGLGAPVLLGASRKRLIGQLAGVSHADARLPGSLATVLAGAAQGVQIFRVHDVAETRQALAVWEAVARGAERSVNA
jgi:dihydropteroate synthase